MNKPISINNLNLDADKICWIEGGQKGSLDMNQNATATSEYSPELLLRIFKRNAYTN